MAAGDWHEGAANAIGVVMRDILGSEVNRLTALFLEVCGRHRRHRDHTRHELHEALREVAACFRVYRTYVRAEAGEMTDTDREEIDRAFAAAAQARPDLESACWTSCATS